MTDLVSLVYTSTAATPFHGSGLESLLDQARRFNADHDVTGILLYRDGRFIQVLEGQAATVDQLMSRIASDERHESVRVLLTELIEHRRFDEWRMGYQVLSDRPGADRLGFRDSFQDLDHGSSDDHIVRALRELTLWYRVRAASS